jgi:CarD family transcriptional regulator
MFKENDMVVYGAHGVCKIAEICEKDFNRKKKVYYVLKPVKSDCSTFFVPADNETLITKMRKILSKEEINKLIDSMPNEKANWIFDETERKEKYKNIISQGDHIELIKMIKAIFFEKKERETNGKRLRASDERFLKDAEQLLYGEFQYVLNLSEDQLMTYIFDRIENNGK